MTKGSNAYYDLDLRGFIKYLEEKHPEEIFRVTKEVDPEFGVSGILHRLEADNHFRTVIFENVKVESDSNFKKLVGEFKLNDNGKIIHFKPEIRVYSQPETITSEADISSTLFSDNFLVFSLIKNDGFFNVRYQHKPLMIWIWISVLLMSLGGVFSFFKLNEK